MWAKTRPGGCARMPKISANARLIFAHPDMDSNGWITTRTHTPPPMHIRFAKAIRRANDGPRITRAQAARTAAQRRTAAASASVVRAKYQCNFHFLWLGLRPVCVSTRYSYRPCGQDDCKDALLTETFRHLRNRTALALRTHRNGSNKHHHAPSAGVRQHAHPA
jgi:hypothetical protein